MDDDCQFYQAMLCLIQVAGLVQRQQSEFGLAEPTINRPQIPPKWIYSKKAKKKAPDSDAFFIKVFFLLNDHFMCYNMRVVADRVEIQSCLIFISINSD